jgi:predicted amidohydrolase
VKWKRLTGGNALLKVAAVQLNSTADTAANIAAAERLTRAAAADGARLIVLPEKWTVLGRDADLRAGAQTLDGPAIAWARGLAQELRIDLVAGSIVERRASESGAPGAAGESGASGVSRPGASGALGAPEASGAPEAPGELLANTSVHIDPQGAPRAVYRKLHMFDVDIEGHAYRESAVTAPGREIVLSATADGVELGLAICYDLRFPELFAALAQRGARIVVLPSAFTLPTTRDHWEILVRARAIENEVFVIAANQVGPHPGGHRSGGSSMIVDPWGTVLARAADGEGRGAGDGDGRIAADGESRIVGNGEGQIDANGEGWIAAELDLDRQLQIRAQLPVLAHRRADVYGRSGGAVR